MLVFSFWGKFAVNRLHLTQSLPVSKDKLTIAISDSGLCMNESMNEHVVANIEKN